MQKNKPIRYLSEGHRLLCGLAASGSEIARAVGVSRQSASSWRAGLTAPDHPKRAILESIYGVPARAWEERPEGAADASAPNVAEMPDAAMPHDVAGLRRLAEDARRARSDGNLTDAAQARWSEIERKARSELSRRYDLTEAEICQLPAMRSIAERVALALAAYPEAARAVADALDPRPAPQVELAP